MAIRKSRTLNLGTGTFVVLGFAALFFLTTQTTSRGISFASPPHYDLTAKFDNIGDLKVGAPVSMSGVEMGRVTKISFDSETYLKNGDQIDFTQSAFVLENLIGQVLANFAKSGGKADAPAAAEPKSTEKPK
jgi:phospholipid/cholesterol/gamma-HCH transport system substrate-binding protein